MEELFSGVLGGRGPRPQYGSAGPPYEGGRLYVLPAVRDEHRLTATFQLPCLNGKYRCEARPYAARGLRCGNALSACHLIDLSHKSHKENAADHCPAGKQQGHGPVIPAALAPFKLYYF